MPVPITAKSFPYRRVWQKTEVAEILDRKDRLAEAMTDAVGPIGQALYVPLDQLHILALHLSLAGCDVDPERAFIVSRVLPDEPGAFEGRREWFLKSEYQAPSPDPDETRATAEAAAEKIRRQLPPDVVAALAEIMRDERSSV